MDFNKVSEVKITYLPQFKASERPTITCASDTVGILRNSYGEGEITCVEYFKVLLLNRANKVLGVSTISKGGQSGTLADPKVIFSTALKSWASSIILCHNHPSGNIQPSQADIALTKKLIEGGNFLDIKVLDHIILTDESHFSFADEGLM